MLLSRREFLARLPAVGLAPTGLLAHHRPNHAGGPPTATAAGFARVSHVALEVPASDTSTPPPSGGWGSTYWGEQAW